MPPKKPPVDPSQPTLANFMKRKPNEAEAARTAEPPYKQPKTESSSVAASSASTVPMPTRPRFLSAPNQSSTSPPKKTGGGIKITAGDDNDDKQQQGNKPKAAAYSSPYTDADYLAAVSPLEPSSSSNTSKTAAAPASTKAPPSAPPSKPVVSSHTASHETVVYGTTSAIVEVGTGGGGGGGATSKTICKYFLSKAGCKDGDKCKYSHTVPLCEHFLKPSGCKYGDSCKDRHDYAWAPGFVKLPWSDRYEFKAPKTGKLCRHWPRIVYTLKEAINSSTDLEEILIALLPPDHVKSDIYVTQFEALIHVLDFGMKPKDQAVFFSSTLPWMKQMVIDAPSLFPKGIPILKQRTNAIQRLTQRQCSAILCLCFFNLMPYRHKLTHYHGKGEGNAAANYSSKLPYMNFGNLFGTGGTNTRHKILCLINYFRMCAELDATRAKNPPMFLEFIRSYERSDNEAAAVADVASSAMASASASPPSSSAASGSGQTFFSHAYPLADLLRCSEQFSDLEAVDDGVIEDVPNAMQADFANRNIGGGVLGRGCVQEEIRMIVCPELLAARAISETLLPNESVLMNGALQYSAYKGYAQDFEMDGALALPTPTAQEMKTRVMNVCVVAMDAQNFNNVNLRPVHQFFPSWIQREARKALISFRGARQGALTTSYSGLIATGNWGCGAFGGDLQLKAMVQMCAASAVRRPIKYFTFGKPEFRAQLIKMHRLLRGSRITVGAAFTSLLRFNEERTKALEKPPEPEELDELAREATLDYETLLEETPEAVWTTELEAAKTGLVKLPNIELSVFEHLEKELSLKKGSDNTH